MYPNLNTLPHSSNSNMQHACYPLCINLNEICTDCIQVRRVYSVSKRTGSLSKAHMPTISVVSDKMSYKEKVVTWQGEREGNRDKDATRVFHSVFSFPELRILLGPFVCVYIICEIPLFTHSRKSTLPNLPPKKGKQQRNKWNTKWKPNAQCPMPWISAWRIWTRYTNAVSWTCERQENDWNPDNLSKIIIYVCHILRSRLSHESSLFVMEIKVLTRGWEYGPDYTALYKGTLEYMLLFVLKSHWHVLECDVSDGYHLTPMDSHRDSDILAMNRGYTYVFDARESIRVIPIVRVFVVVCLNYDPNPHGLKCQVPVGYVSDITATAWGSLDPNSSPRAPNEDVLYCDIWDSAWHLTPYWYTGTVHSLLKDKTN